MEQLVRNIVNSIVQHKDAVDLRSFRGDATTVFELRVHPDDAGFVIGKNGRTVAAIRTVLASAQLRSGRAYRLEVIAPLLEPRPCGSIRPTPPSSGSVAA